jgi:hypothetical protein
MTEPIVFISRNRIKPGLFEDFDRHYRESLPATETGKPGTLVQLAFVSDDLTEVSIVRVFPDAQALDLQLQGADERSRKTYQFIEPTGVEIYGNPGGYAMEMMKKVAGSGIQVKIMPRYIGGFIRPQSG